MRMLKREIKRLQNNYVAKVNGAKEPYGAASHLLNSYS